MSYLSIKDGQLQVPNQLTVPFIQGDGIGPEIWQASKKVIDTAIYKPITDKKPFSGKKFMLDKRLLKNSAPIFLMKH